MNQILYVQEKKKNEKADIKTIIRFFCIAIIVFGIVLISQGSYALYTNSSTEKVQENIKPTINTLEEDGMVILSVTHEKGISKIMYNWNGQETVTIQGNNRTSITEEIDLPVGTNTLNIKVYDIESKETTYRQEYEVEDLGEAKIDFVIGNNTSTMKIKVTDTKGLSYITYKWNDEAAETLEADPTDKTLIEKEIEIPFGLNTLTVVAVNVEGITKTKEQEVKGVKSTKVEAKLDEQGYLVITLTDEAGIKSINHVSNDTETFDIPGEGKTVFEYKQQLGEGQNKAKLTIINNDDVKTEQEIIVNN